MTARRKGKPIENRPAIERLISDLARDAGGFGGGGGGGTGDVVGPAGAVNNRVVAFDGVTGKLIKDSGSTVADIVAAGAAAAPQGDVVGPAGAVADRIAVYNGVTGKLVKDGGITIADWFDQAVKVASNPTFGLPAFTNGFKERGRSDAAGEWIDVAFAAGNFTAAAGNWTVDAGDQINFAYTLIGKTMIVAFGIQGTDVSAAPSTLRLPIPGGASSAIDARATTYVSDAGTFAVGVARVVATDTLIYLYRNVDTSLAWSTTAGDNTDVFGLIAFEIL